MFSRRTVVASSVAVCLAFTGNMQAFAGGLISTERLVEQSSARTMNAAPAAVTPESLATDRAALMSALLLSGLDVEQAQARLNVLTNAEVTELGRTLNTAPAGGLWFVPFLLVAAMIGALIGSREPSGKATTDLFGHPRIATAP